MAVLPDYVEISFDGYQETKEPGVLRSDFEDGPPRQARFKSRTMRTRSVNLFFAKRSDYLAFVQWFDKDLRQGALFFDMTDPVTNKQISARFVGGTYTAKPMGANLEQWMIKTEIESWGES